MISRFGRVITLRSVRRDFTELVVLGAASLKAVRGFDRTATGLVQDPEKYLLS